MEQQMKIYTDRTEAAAEAKRLNGERKRTNIEYVVGEQRDYANGGALIGYYIGVCSDD